MGEFSVLSNDHKDSVIAAVLKVLEGLTGVQEFDQAYAYRHSAGGISWGVNAGAAGFCIARGVLYSTGSKVCHDTLVAYFDGRRIRVDVENVIRVYLEQT